MKLNSKKLTIGLLIACLLLATVSTAAATEWPMFQNNPRHTGYVNQDTSYSTSQWTVTLDGAVKSPAALSSDKIYVGTEKGTLYALSAKDGNTTWSYDTGSSIYSTPCVVGDTVYVGSDNGYMYSNNADRKSVV